MSSETIKPPSGFRTAAEGVLGIKAFREQRAKGSNIVVSLARGAEQIISPVFDNQISNPSKNYSAFQNKVVGLTGDIAFTVMATMLATTVPYTFILPTSELSPRIIIPTALVLKQVLSASFNAWPRETEDSSEIVREKQQLA